MTVMVPDLVLICENMLMAEGFEESQVREKRERKETKKETKRERKKREEEMNSLIGRAQREEKRAREEQNATHSFSLTSFLYQSTRIYEI